MDRALEVQHLMARRGQHRVPDLMIAAAADVGGATLLHYDGDFDRIAEGDGAGDEVDRRTGHGRLTPTPGSAELEPASEREV